METNNSPFYVGQRLICVQDTMPGFGRKVIEKREEVTVRKAYDKCLFFNEVINPPHEEMTPSDDFEPAYPTKDFAPINPLYADISSELAQQAMEDKIETDVVVKETQTVKN